MTRLNKALAGAVLASAIGGLYTLEGVEYTAYTDIAGVPTICAGTTQGVRMGDRATPQQCWDMTVRDYRKHEAAVLQAISIPLNVNEQTALTYFCYNVGNAACQASTAFKLFNQGRTREGCHALAKFNKVRINGKLVVSKGLVNLRNAEIARCLEPSSLYSSSP